MRDERTGSAALHSGFRDLRFLKKKLLARFLKINQTAVLSLRTKNQQFTTNPFGCISKAVQIASSGLPEVKANRAQRRAMPQNPLNTRKCRDSPSDGAVLCGEDNRPPKWLSE